MALNHSPSIVTNGLVMYYDMSNTKKSWKGAPTTNLFGDVVNYSGLGSYWYNLDTNTKSIMLSVSYASWCVYFVATLTANSSHTFSCEHRSDVPGSTFVLDNDGVDDNTWNATVTSTTEWQRYTFTRTNISAGQMNMYIRRNSGGNIYVRNVQIESTLFATPFVNGTRSNTQAIVDLTNNNTLTATSLTYANDGTFSFNGSSSWIELPTSSLFDSQSITMESWNKPTATAQSGFLFEKGQVNTQYSNFYNSDGTFYFRTIGLSPQDLTFAAATHIIAGQWNHIVCVVGSGTKTVYINGVQRYQQTGVTGTIPTGQTNQYVGKYGGGAINYPFNGSIGVSKVYNRVLTETEVQQNFNALRGRYGI